MPHHSRHGGRGPLRRRQVGRLFFQPILITRRNFYWEEKNPASFKNSEDLINSPQLEQCAAVGRIIILSSFCVRTVGRKTLRGYTRCHNHRAITVWPYRKASLLNNEYSLIIKMAQVNQSSWFRTSLFWIFLGQVGDKCHLSACLLGQTSSTCLQSDLSMAAGLDGCLNVHTMTHRETWMANRSKPKPFMSLL